MNVSEFTAAAFLVAVATVLIALVRRPRGVVSAWHAIGTASHRFTTIVEVDDGHK